MVNIDKSIKMSDVIGLKDVKELLKERLHTYFKYKDKMPNSKKGMLLYGYPGTGKTMVVIAMMNNLDDKKVLCKIVDTSDITVHVGSTSKAVKKYFQDLRKEANGRDIVLLMDEADEILPIKNPDKAINTERVSAILRELDGIENDNKNIFIICTTNHPTRIEPAMLRSGRIDDHIRVNLPNDVERLELITHYLKDIPGCEKYFLDICFGTPKWTGADYKKLQTELCLQYLMGKDKDGENYQVTPDIIVKMVNRVGKSRKTNFKKFEAEYKAYQGDEEEDCNSDQEFILSDTPIPEPIKNPFLPKNVNVEDYQLTANNIKISGNLKVTIGNLTKQEE